jgi:hypothetical protein
MKRMDIEEKRSLRFIAKKLPPNFFEVFLA